MAVAQINEACSTLRGRIKGTAHSIFSIMRYGGQYSKAGDNIARLGTI